MMFFPTLLCVAVFSVIPLLVYALTAVGKRNFRWWYFFATTKNRLIVLALLDVIASLAVTAWPEARPILPAALNFVGGALAIAIPNIANFMTNLDEAVAVVVGNVIIGLMNGALCVMALRGKNK